MQTRPLFKNYDPQVIDQYARVAQGMGTTTEMIITERFRRIAVVRDEATAAYPGAKTLHAARPAGTPARAGSPVRAVVELYVPLGGMLARALLGGRFQPGDGPRTTFEVQVADQSITLDSPATCTSSLGSALIAGLITEFADAALAGVSTPTGTLGLPAGTLRVDRAGCSPEGSSNYLFGLAGNLLRRALAAELYDADVATELQDALTHWHH